MVRGLRTCLLLCAALPLSAQDFKDFEKRVTEFTLPNGLQFLVVERHDAPVLSFHTYVRVGTADDVTGRTGLAYLTERVLFTGTEGIGSRSWPEERKAQDAIEEIYDRLESERNLGARGSRSRIDTLETQLRLAIDTARRYGASEAYATALDEGGVTRLSHNVSPDETECSYSLPSNRIEFWFLMESQRLLRPSFRGFYANRDALVEQRQKGAENMQTRMFNAFSAAAFQAHPYRNPAAGWPGDVAGLRRTDARAFFDRYYVPGNVVMAIVGDANPAEAKALAGKYFGPWAAKPVPPLVPTQEPPQAGPKTVVLESSSAGIALIGYKRPSQFEKEDAALDLLQIILAHGKTGLLYKEMVTDKHLTQRLDIGATFPAGRYVNTFLFLLAPAQGHTVDENQQALEEFLNRLKTRRLDADIIARAKDQARVVMVNRLAVNSGLASLLAVSQGSYGDWRKLFTTTEDLKKVTAEDIQRVLARYFVPAGRTTVYTVLPGQSGTPAAKPATPSGDKQ